MPHGAHSVAQYSLYYKRLPGVDYLRLSANPHLSEATTIRRSDDHPKSQTMYYVKKPWKFRNLPVLYMRAVQLFSCQLPKNKHNQGLGMVMAQSFMN
jgi:hypothetical protein